ISCDLGLGNGAFEAYGCDLGYEYVKINADYRT
ncbi:MAG: bifunctional ornithine acetyltransferase/N-acetylglutamate synthase, partial [Thiovulaceae bacterium]|nr:bifunctional ornithine acetyltransferase/N-acetylglutamate synthase [Sulfurimonadaceae bacterium]